MISMLPTIADLFDAPLLAGFDYHADIMAPHEETQLIARINDQPLTPFRFQGWSGKRVTKSFGWHYDFDNGRFGQTDPIPEWLLPIKRRAADFARIDDDHLVQALLIRYDPGAGIGWHRDRPVFEHVVGISLGELATMRFRRRRANGFDRVSAPLTPRSVYHLSSDARYEWEHSIAPMAVARWSITFRTFARQPMP